MMSQLKLHKFNPLKLTMLKLVYSYSISYKSVAVLNLDIYIIQMSSIKLEESLLSCTPMIISLSYFLVLH